MDGRGYSGAYADIGLLPWFFGWEAVKPYQNTRSWTIGVLRAPARRIPIRRQSGGVVQDDMSMPEAAARLIEEIYNAE